MKYLTKFVGKSRTNDNGNYVLPRPSSLSGILTQSAAQVLRRSADGRFTLPGNCILCAADSGADLLCPGCVSDLPGLPAMRCPRCGESTTHGEHCGACLQHPPAFSGVHALFRYDFPVDRLIHALKYQHCLSLATWFGQRLASILDAAAFDSIVPLPLHPSRLRQRGFNQSMETGRVLASFLQRPLVHETLIRQKVTETQAGLDRQARRNNVRQAFACTGRFDGLRLLLVDDVMTSGASADECARTLLQHGAESVRVAVVARTLNR